MIHPDDILDSLSIRMQALNSSRSSFTLKHRICHKAGHFIWVEVNANIIREPHTEKPVETIEVIRDITERKRAEDILRQSLEKEKELSELKSRIVSMASHEFRTPLATILASIETLAIYRQKMTEDKIEEKFTKIKEQIGHLTRITEDVLVLTRVQTGRVEFNPVMVDLDALCRTIIEEFQSRHDIQHHFVYSFDGLVQSVRLDPKLMRQIISNLISNATKYSPPSKPVGVHLEFTSNALVFSVSDQGVGILESDQKHIFEPFHRASNVGGVSGTGLGLSITKEFVELHSGTITFVSQAGEGTTFTVTIPVTAQGGNVDDKNLDN